MSAKVSKTEQDTIHATLDKCMDTEDTCGVMMICCTFTQDGMRVGACAVGIMSMDQVVQAIAKGGGGLLEQIEQQTAQQRAEMPSSEVVQ